MTIHAIRDLVPMFQELVRPLVTLALTAGLVWGFAAGKVSAEAYLGAAAVVLGFWFRERQELRDRETPAAR